MQVEFTRHDWQLRYYDRGACRIASRLRQLKRVWWRRERAGRSRWPPRRQPRQSDYGAPGGLENFHRYRTLIRVRYLTDTRTTIDVLLDGKPYFPHWEGNPTSLDGGPAAASADPRRTEPEFGVWDSGAILHSLRLRMLSGEAALTND